MVDSRSVSECLWRTDYELCPTPLSILLLAAIGAKLIGLQDGLKVGKCAVHDLLPPFLLLPPTPTPRLLHPDYNFVNFEPIMTEIESMTYRYADHGNENHS